MSLSPNTQIAHYTIISKIGAGGMGEVYRARDTRLDRDVAIKFLPAEVSTQADRLERFEQEARATSALNHPNILIVHDIGTHEGSPYIVSELLDGEELRDRLNEGKIPLRKTIQYAQQIVSGLSAAHEKGIVHRDLKPENLFITKDDRLKILDFGLAKLRGPANDGSSTEAETRKAITNPGVVMGTVGYMSPEQVRGEKIDHRSDIFSFGVILFEMLAGQRAFHRDSVVEVMHAILKDDVPDLDGDAPKVTPALDKVMRRCLEKKPEHRFRSTHDLGFALEALSSPTTSSSSGLTTTTEAVKEKPRARRNWLSIGIVAILLGVAALIGAFVSRWLTPKPTLASVVRMVEELPIDQSPSGDARTRIAISPDGKNLVYVAKQKLYLRALDAIEAAPIAGTEGGNNPFFSPDGKWIGFWASGGLKKVPVTGGTPVSLCNTEMIGASWGTDDTILIGAIYGGILRVSANGGTPERVVEPKPSLAYHYPQYLPDGKSFLFSRGTPGSFAQNQLVIRSLGSNDETVVVEGSYNFTYLTSGILLYTVASNTRAIDLQAIAFDPKTKKTSGEPINIARNVSLTTAGSGGQFAASDNGTLVYLPSAASGSQSRLVRVKQTGEVEVLPAEQRLYSDPRVSPDGSSVAVHQQGDENDVWVASVERGTLTRLSFNPGEDETPAFSPDGRTVAWAGSRADLLRGISKRPADGSGSEEVIFSLNIHAHVRDWTPDGKSLIFEAADPKTNNDIWRLDLGDKPTATPVIQTPYNEHNSRLSPDGKWIAYSSNESGRDEIYIQPYPQGGSRLLVTSSGGDQPVWARNGLMLFYRGDNSIFAVDFAPGPQPSVSNVRTLFPDRFDNPQAGNHTGYDVFPDGRLLMLQSPLGENTRTKIIIVFNWLEELKQKLGR